jgi:hypothetical protein
MTFFIGSIELKLHIYMGIFYYWFSVGEGTLPLHHLIAQNTPARSSTLQPMPPLGYQAP